MRDISSIFISKTCRDSSGATGLSMQRRPKSHRLYPLKALHSSPAYAKVIVQGCSASTSRYLFVILPSSTGNAIKYIQLSSPLKHISVINNQHESTRTKTRFRPTRQFCLQRMSCAQGSLPTESFWLIKNMSKMRKDR
jgi:hypothetical protein